MFITIDRELTIQFVMMLVGIFVALWNIYVFFSAANAKKEAKNSEIKAAEYAEQANEYYKITAKFYEREIQKQDLELKRLMEIEKRESAYEKKMSVLKVIDKEGIMKTSRVANILGLDILETFDILCELQQHDRLIGSGGNPDRNDVDNNVWIKRSR